MRGVSVPALVYASAAFAKGAPEVLCPIRRDRKSKLPKISERRYSTQAFFRKPGALNRGKDGERGKEELGAPGVYIPSGYALPCQICR